ncbi:MAG: HlyD family efflux transporter periplasmic adaptor subunit, partial [Planctomyces sp.]
SELRAPSAGRILRIVSRPGEKISEKGIMELGDVSRMEAVAEVFEADVTLLRLKMTADVIFDASGDRMTGVVSEIGNQVARKVVLTNDPVSDTDARVVEVRVRLDDQFMERVARLSNARVEIHIQLDDAGAADSNSPSFSSSQTAIH